MKTSRGAATSYTQLRLKDEARNRILAGATLLADALRPTLGPKSKCVLIDRKWGSPLAFARQRLGPAVAPKEIELRTALPPTRSGKLMRRLLRARVRPARGRCVDPGGATLP